MNSCKNTFHINQYEQVLHIALNACKAKMLYKY